MKLEKPTASRLKASLFDDVSQDVSQTKNTAIHRREQDTGSAGGSVYLQRVPFSQRLKDGRYRADDPGRGLPGIGYFQTNALATEKNAACAGFSLAEKKSETARCGLGAVLLGLGPSRLPFELPGDDSPHPKSGRPSQSPA